MPDPLLLPFGEFRPDVSDYEAEYTNTLANVLPRADGYGPFANFAVFSVAAAGACRGLFYARKNDGSVLVFYATSTRIYTMSNTDTTFTDVSKGGSAYSAVPAGENWQFEQFNNFVFAVQVNTAPQVWDLTSSSAFADLGGSPPQARYISVVNRFVVLSGLAAPNVYRVQWSGLNATTTWTSGVTQSDFQDLPDGGFVRGVAGGEFGVILQDQSIRRMTYAPGAPYTFQIDRIAKDEGILAPQSLIRAGDRVFFYSGKGFKMIQAGGAPTPIGKERVDRSFAADVDQSSLGLGLFIGANDPRATRVFWAYKSLTGTTGFFDKMICYDYGLDKFTPIAMSGEYLTTFAVPGLTLESLDTIAAGALMITGAADNGAGLIRITVASTSTLTTGQIKAISGIVGTTEANGNWTITVHNSTTFDLQGSTFTNAYTSGGIVGGSLDALTTSLDLISTAALPQICAVDTSNRVGFFSGANLEASMTTSEQGNAGRRVYVNGFRPITDAPTVYGSLTYRENLLATATTDTERSINALGACPQNRSTRYARGKVRIPSGTAWTYAIGVEPDVTAEGFQ